jgi:hypothetical protein
LHRYTCKFAAEYGHLECIKYAHEKGCPWSTDTSTGAAKNNHIECLKYLHENGCPWNSNAYYYAAANGHLECIKYLHQNGCPWSIDTCASAAENGQLDCLKYLHENGCPWSSNTCKYAAYYHIDCLKYAHENGCPYPHLGEYLSIIVKKVLIPKWRDAVKTRSIVYYWMECSAKTSCGQNGRARIEDINSFENDFKFIL